MADRSDLTELIGRHIGWVALSGLVLGSVWGMAAVILIPRWELFSLTRLVDLADFVLRDVVGCMAVGAMGGVLVGIGTGLPHALIARLIPVPRRQHLYRWTIRVVAIVASPIMARYWLAVWAYWAGDFNWDLGWNREELPTLGHFLWAVIVPVVLAVIGTCWATERGAAWHVRVVTAVQAPQAERSDPR